MDTKMIRDSVQRDEREMVEYLCNLIRYKSFTGQEKEVVEDVASKMKEMGYDEIMIDSVGNVVGKIGSGPKNLVFDAHLDIVEADEPDWESQPFTGTVRDGHVYGRGSMDCKGPFVSTLYAGKVMKVFELTGEFTVYVIGSVSEETAEGLATRAFLEENGIIPDYVVIAEASGLRICRGHRGRSLIEAYFKGAPVHASIHSQGINAIEKALPFASAISQLNQRLPVDPILGKGDICVTAIECDSNSYNSLPAACKVVIDRRMTMKDTRESVCSELKELPGASGAESIRYMDYAEDSYTGYHKAMNEYFPAWIMDENHELIKAGKKTFTALFSEPPTVDVWGFCTNGTYTNGEAGFPTLGFGPGEETLAHKVNENVPIDELVKSAQFYALLPWVLSGKMD